MDDVFESNLEPSVKDLPQREYRYSTQKKSPETRLRLIDASQGRFEMYEDWRRGKQEGYRLHDAQKNLSAKGPASSALVSFSAAEIGKCFRYLFFSPSRAVWDSQVGVGAEPTPADPAAKQRAIDAELNRAIKRTTDVEVNRAIQGAVSDPGQIGASRPVAVRAFCLHGSIDDATKIDTSGFAVKDP